MANECPGALTPGRCAYTCGNTSMESFSSQCQDATCNNGNEDDFLYLEEDTCQAITGEFLG